MSRKRTLALEALEILLELCMLPGCLLVAVLGLCGVMVAVGGLQELASAGPASTLGLRMLLVSVACLGLLVAMALHCIGALSGLMDLLGLLETHWFRSACCLEPLLRLSRCTRRCALEALLACLVLAIDGLLMPPMFGAHWLPRHCLLDLYRLCGSFLVITAVMAAVWFHGERKYHEQQTIPD